MVQNYSCMSILLVIVSVSISAWSTFTLDHLRQNLRQVINVSATFCTVNCFPKRENSLNEFFFVSWLYLSSQMLMFSIGLQSGDSGGVRHQLTPWSMKNCWALADVCFGSLFLFTSKATYTPVRNACSSLATHSLVTSLEVRSNFATISLEVHSTFTTTSLKVRSTASREVRSNFAQSSRSTNFAWSHIFRAYRSMLHEICKPEVEVAASISVCVARWEFVSWC